MLERTAAVSLSLPFLGMAALLAVSLISVEDEVAFGRDLRRQMRQQTAVVRDPDVVAYIRDLGRRLAASSQGPKYPYTFDVADARPVNAFALPGGSIWIHRGAIQQAGSEAQVVALLAHEVAHVSERQAAAQLSAMMLTRWGLGLMGALLGNAGGAVTAHTTAQAVVNGTLLRFNREDEREADRVGVRLMHRAGWDARGMVDLMETLRRTASRDPGLVEQFFSSHPALADRSRAVRAIASTLHGGTRDTRRFHDVQARLQRLRSPQRRPVTDN
jgi:beta-barrel assembly-enhancing protease